MDKIKLYSKPTKGRAASANGPPSSPKSASAPKKAAKARQKAPKNSGGKKKLVSALLICLALVFVALGILGFSANSGDAIFSSLSMEGVDLSGLTAAAAADKLLANGVGTEDDKTLVLSLPAGVELQISAKEAGVYYTAWEASAFAYDYCRDASFFTTTIRYLKAGLFGLKLSYADMGALDKDYLSAQVSEGVNAARLALMESSVQIGEESITVIKGGNAVNIDSDSIEQLLTEALRAGDFSPLKYAAETVDAIEVEQINLTELYEAVFQEPENAKYDPETQQATAHTMGRSFDIEAAQKLWDRAENGDSLEIPLILVEPEITQERLSAMLFADLLAQKGTTLAGSSSARINNITKAAAAINGLVMNPGDEFSFNGVVGERKAADGYQAAGAYNNGQVVSEVGGGICQMSSTLYYCALISNLEITNRLAHMFAVSYLPPGLDATVSWPGPDFKFKNDSEYPIKISTWVDKAQNILTVQIHGSNPEGIRVEMSYESWVNPDGTGAVTYRSVFDRGGNLLSRKEEARSRYTYPEKESPSPSPSPSPSASPSPSPSAPPTEPPTTPPVTPPPTEEPTPPPPTPTLPVEDTETGV